MATSSTGGVAVANSRWSSATARLIDFTSRSRSANVLLLTRLKPSFCIRCVSGEPKQRVCDPITDEGDISLHFLLNLEFY